MARHDAHQQRASRFPLRLVTAVILVILSAASSLNQVSAQEPDEVVRIRTDLVTIPLVVTDSRGHRIANLNRDDFVLTDYDRTAKIDYFASGTERVALLFALDASGSEREVFGSQREAALALFSRFGSGSRVAVLHFANYVRLSVPFTTDSGAAQAAFNSEAGASGGTAIFDGAAAAVRSFDVLRNSFSTLHAGRRETRASGSVQRLSRTGRTNRRPLLQNRRREIRARSTRTLRSGPGL